MAHHPPDASGRITMRVAPYTPVMKEEIRAIHMATASERARTDQRHGRFSLLMYCDEYLDHETAYVLVDDDENPAGYILCAENAYEWAEHMKPYAEEIRALGDPYDKRVSAQIEEYQLAAAEYPAHLHIDILEKYTGRHGGSMLMETLRSHLQSSGCLGVCLGVGRANERAFSFYRHFGFEILAEDEGGWFLGLKIR